MINFYVSGSEKKNPSVPSLRAMTSPVFDANHVVCGAFHDRSTKGLHHYIFDFDEILMKYGSPVPCSLWCHRQIPKVNGSRDMASGIFARSRCRVFFEGM